MNVYDVAVIGAGVVGAAIARQLARYDVRVALIEAGPDVGAGTSKSNTAIHHTGFDAVPGTLEAALLRRAFPLMEDYAAQAGLPLQKTGALLIAWSQEQLARLPAIANNADAVGYTRARHVSPGELYRREPHLGPGAKGALEIPDEGIICPFTTPLAFATEAVVNGVALLLEAPVTSVCSAGPGVHALTCGSHTVCARWVVNAAGLGCGAIDRLFGHGDFTVRPRRGELIIFDKVSRGLLSHVLLPVPTARSKGILVAPTVFGNVLLGPTSDDVEGPGATGTTEAGQAALMEHGRRILPELMDEEITAAYAGLRAATEHADYQIRCHEDQRYVTVGGIRSTGLSSSIGIGAYVAELLADAGLVLEEKRSYETVRMPQLGEASLRPYQDGEAIAVEPDYGRIVCHCERVTLGEIAAACRSPIPPRTLDGLRRRTRVTMGRCQGFYCEARVTATLARLAGRPISELLGVTSRHE